MSNNCLSLADIVSKWKINLLTEAKLYSLVGRIYCRKDTAIIKLIWLQPLTRVFLPSQPTPPPPYSSPTTACETSIVNFKNWILYNKAFAFDGPSLNYYVLVVSKSHYKYLKGSIYHWDTAYQQRWISCASKGQWFRHINMFMGIPQCLDLKIIAVMTNRGCSRMPLILKGYFRVFEVKSWEITISNDFLTSAERYNFLTFEKNVNLRIN